MVETESCPLSSEGQNEMKDWRIGEVVAVILQSYCPYSFLVPYERG